MVRCSPNRAVRVAAVKWLEWGMSRHLQIDSNASMD
jgi:hypothetical protein